MEIKVYKSKKILEVWESDDLVKTYQIAIGKSEVGHKEVEGDGSEEAEIEVPTAVAIDD